VHTKPTVDIRRPAVEAKMGEVVRMVLADVRQPHRPELDAGDVCHVSPEGSVPRRALRVGVGEGGGALGAAARLHAVNAVRSPVVPWEEGGCVF
jgi:hypothetical protein